MNTPSFSIPYEKQTDPHSNRGCGAACLRMVYKSFGKDVPQASIWPLIAKPNRFGAISSTTHLMALHAMSQGLSALAVQARHPIQALRLCRDAGIRVILNHRLEPGAPAGHYTVFVDMDDTSVVLHDPSFGPSRRVSHAELLELWQPSSSNSEIVGNIMIGIAADPAPVPACEFCHTAIPPLVDCPKCGKTMAMAPAALLGCVRDGCIARMWNYLACPWCDSLFTKAEKAAGDRPSAAEPGQAQPGLELPDLDKVFLALDQFCSQMLSFAGTANRADLKTQLDFIQASKDRLRLAQAEELASIQAHLGRINNFADEARKKAEQHQNKVRELNTPLSPLDGKALGQALLKNLGFR